MGTSLLRRCVPVQATRASVVRLSAYPGVAAGRSDQRERLAAGGGAP